MRLGDTTKLIYVNKLVWSKSEKAKVGMESSQAGGFLFTDSVDWRKESRDDSRMD